MAHEMLAMSQTYCEINPMLSPLNPLRKGHHGHHLQFNESQQISQKWLFLNILQSTNMKSTTRDALFRHYFLLWEKKRASIFPALFHPISPGELLLKCCPFLITLSIWMQASQVEIFEELALLVQSVGLTQVLRELLVKRRLKIGSKEVTLKLKRLQVVTTKDMIKWTCWWLGQSRWFILTKS